MKKQTYVFTRSDKILLVLYRLAHGTKKNVRFEDIAVRCFNTYPQDFQLKGYPQYPDTGDLVHKPLYSELKKKGLVLSGNKYFSLTQKGAEKAKLLESYSSVSNKFRQDATKFTAAQEVEVQNILGSTAYMLFTDGKGDNILDIDFYNYLGVTVRTDKYDFLGRLSSVEDAIKAVGIRKPEVGKSLDSLHRFLMNKFESNARFFLNHKGGK